MNYQYYPTGEHTAAIMWSKFKTKVAHLCEPNAGQGHLIRYALDGFTGLSEDQLPWLQENNWLMRAKSDRQREEFLYYARKRLNSNITVSVIEIDVNHHPNLKALGKKVQIVGYDFLQTESLATVSHVIMNPPFAEGAKHVLHAWDIVYDAEIVACINAETIRKPYTQERKRLIELINQFGSVEFMQDQFTNNVDRKTDVEIAIVYLQKIPEASFSLEDILKQLSPKSAVGDIDPQIENALALPSNLVENTFQRYKLAVNATMKAIHAEAVAQHTETALGIALDEMQAKGVGSNFRHELTIEKLRETINDSMRERLQKLNKVAWGQIIRSGLLTDKLSNQARRKLESEAESIYQLEFSVANVHGFLSGVFNSLGDIYTDMICGLFDSIIGRSSDNVAFYKSWKSNEKHRFGMRIRRSRFIFPISTGSHGLQYESSQFLADVDKVFGYLHGIQGSYDGLVKGFEARLHAGGERASTKFFDYRYYAGAGTIHIYPKSAEVIEKLNRFVGKQRQWLPGQMEEANDDFKKQYDKAEDLTNQYFKASRDDNSKYSSAALKEKILKDKVSSCIYAALRDNQTESDHLVCERVAEAIEHVHKTLDLHCGAALTYEPKKAAPVQQQALMLECA